MDAKTNGVLAVMDAAVHKLGAESSGADIAGDLLEARDAIADAIGTLRLDAEAMEIAAEAIGGDIGMIMAERAMFARAALARLNPQQ